MPKHATETATLAEIINRIDSSRHTDDQWYDVMGLDIDGLDAAIESGDLDTATQIEADYLRQHERDMYEIRWPEHVISPRYNSDASFHCISE